MPDIEAVKAAGLAVDLYRYTQEGYRAVTADDHYRLKTLGICGQKGEGHFMLRIKVPGGLTAAERLETLADLADRFAGGMLHLTTRQGVELHSVQIEHVPAIFAGLASIGLTTRAACGDTIRNVVGCPQAGVCIHERLDARPWIEVVGDYFLALGPERLNLPRKMNVYVGGCPECAGHAQINDFALVAGPPDGFQLWVGGGLGANPRLAHLLDADVPFAHAIPACAAIVDVYIAHGHRASRARAKLKFLIESWGIERFRYAWRDALEARLARGEGVLPSAVLADPRALGLAATEPWGDDRPLPAGVSRQRQAGLHRVGVHVPLGELSAADARAVSLLARAYGGGAIQITKEQNLELRDVAAQGVPPLVTALVAQGFEPAGADAPWDVQSCPGTAFCPIAVTPSQDAAARLARLPILRSAGLRGLRIHISGCPNSCAQHQVADLGLGGARVPIDELESTFGYQLFLGGAREPIPRLGTVVQYAVPDERLDETVDYLCRAFLAERQPDEPFHEWVDRVGTVALASRLEREVTAGPSKSTRGSAPAPAGRSTRRSAPTGRPPGPTE